MKKDPEIICYGCGRGENPENTIEAINHCQNINSNWRIDLDLQLTKDGEVVLFHDYNTNRRTGVNHNIFDLTLNEVKQLNAGFYFKKRGQYFYRNNPIKIPTLKEVFSLFPKAKYVLDIHTDNDRIIDKIIDIISTYKNAENIIIVSHYDTIIRDFKRKKPNWCFGVATNELKKMVFSSFIFLDFFFPLKSDVLLIPIKYNKIKLLTNRVIKHVKKRNKKIIVWMKEGKTNDDVVCINSKKDYILLKKKGIDAIYTEFPELMNEEIK